jgi:carboxyl-terminal processing protease
MLNKKNVMRYKSSAIIILVLGFFFVKGIVNEPPYEEKESLILHGVMQFIDQVHYNPKPINDDFSKNVFDTYIDRIDGGKRYFIQDDIDQLSKFRLELDEQTTARSFEFFDLSLELLNSRMKESRTYYDEIMESEFDFDEIETIELDEEKMPWAQNRTELKEYWRKFLKYEILTRVSRALDKQEKGKEKFSDTPEFEKAPMPEGEESDGDNNDDKVVEIKTVEQLIVEAKEDVNERFGDWFERLDDLRRSDRFETYVGTITNYFDPHTGYFNPKEKQDFDINMGGKLEGIGARLRQEDDHIKVVEIIAGGPAWKGKELEVNDLFLAVTQEGGEPVDVVGMRTDDAIQMIRGKKGTVVILTIEKPDGSVVDIRIERDEVIIDESFARSAIIDIPGVIENVGYIKLPKFYSSFEKEDGNSCSKDVAKELEKLKANNVNGIILDLRNNTGGSLNDVVDMSGLFIEKGPIVQVKGRKSKAYVHQDTDESVQYDGPLIVMTNSNSASASEILAAAMQDYGRAIIVGGESTFGKGSVQRFYNLDRAIRGSEEFKPLGNIKMSVQKFFRVNGGSTQLKGVIPDVILPDNYSYIDAGEKEYKNTLPWDEIEAKTFKQDVVKLNHLDKIIKNSKDRIQKDDDFILADSRAKMIKVSQDVSEYSLNLEQYRAYRAEKDKEAEQYKELMKNDIESLSISNLSQDESYIKSDESRVGRNEEWLKSMKKDFYIEENMLIMKDMIQSEPSFALIAKKLSKG